MIAVKNIKSVLAVLLSTVLISGCVTSSNSAQPAADKAKMLENRLQLAVRYIQSNNHERAREHLKRAMEIDSRSPELHDVLALLYQHEREFSIAEEHYKKALRYDPKFTRSRNNYGSFLLSQGRLQEACEQFKIGVKNLQYPHRAELFYKLGSCSQRLDQRDQAREYLRKALALNPRFAGASLELAQIYFTEKNYPQAKQLLNRYNKYRSRPSARGLWLGIRLEHIFDNKDARDSQGLALKNLFSNSKENLQYQNWLKNGYKH